MSTTTNTTVDMPIVHKEKKPRAPPKKKVLSTEVPILESTTTIVVDETLTNNDDTVLTKEKKPRAPSLPAKYAKFIQFGYWFLKLINDDPNAPAVDEQLFFDKLNLFTSVDQQQTFVQSFFDSSKSVNKEIRDRISYRRKNDLKSAKAALKAAAKASNPKPKKYKSKIVQNVDPLVSQLVNVASSI